MRITLVTDSTSDLPQDLRGRLGVRVVPLYVNLSGAIYRDWEEITPTEIFQKVREGAAFPTTSQPSPEDFARVYREALGEGMVGVDPPPAFLEVAQRRRPGAYLLAHGERLPFREGAFSGVAIGPTWNEFLDPEGAAREARRVLRPGGRLFGLLLLGPGASLGLFRPTPEALLRLLEGAGFRAEVRRLGRLGLVLAEVG